MIETIKTPAGPTQAHKPGDKIAAARLAQGLTLVPYRAYNQRGHLTWYSKWTALKPGETLAQAAVRLSVPPPSPVWTPQLKARVAMWLRAWGHNPEEIL